MYFFLGLFSLFFKWFRFIFVLISFELLVMSLFFCYSFFLSELMFFYFMCFVVLSSVAGVLVMILCVKSYGSDQALF